MVDEMGYPHLIDLGTAKILKNNLKKTYTILGTPHYMAPEILQGTGYGFNIDLWSLGICMFEFMCGFVPFGEEEEDPYVVYQLITSSELKYPEYFLTTQNKQTKDFIDTLLNRIPEFRLGDSFSTLKSHKWFEDFDWNTLTEKTMKSPYKPPINLFSEDEV